MKRSGASSWAGTASAPGSSSASRRPGWTRSGRTTCSASSAGPLTAPRPSPGRVTPSSANRPLTGTWGDANSGGSFSAFLKFSGYDAVFFKGASEKPVYLFIDNGKAEIRDAAHLWGKDTYETDDILKASWAPIRPSPASGLPGKSWRCWPASSTTRAAWPPAPAWARSWARKSSRRWPSAAAWPCRWPMPNKTRRAEELTTCPARRRIRDHEEVRHDVRDRPQRRGRRFPGQELGRHRHPRFPGRQAAPRRRF